MSAIVELDVLINDLVDGLLDEAGVARLESLLSADANARLRYRRFLAVNANLRWDYVAASREQSAAPLLLPRRRWLPAFIASAALLMVALVLGLWFSDRPYAILTVGEIAGGSLTWSDGAGDRRQLSGGEFVPAGQFVLEGASASVALRFADGSSVVLTGDSDIEVAEAGQKRLRLARGALTADVQPQPAERPLLVRTGTAQLQVLGTRFTVTATAAQTMLDVEHGRVRLERLADGQVVEVATQQVAVASLDVSHSLTAAQRVTSPISWTLDLTRPAPSHWTGTWVAQVGGTTAFMRAAPYIAARSAQGKPIIHHGVRVCSSIGENRPFVRFVAGSVLTLRFRVARPDGRARLDVMVCTHTGNGAFGGTFTAAIQAERHQADADGWRTARLRVEDFVPARTDQPSMFDREAVFILPRSTSAQTGLEVAAISVEAP